MESIVLHIPEEALLALKVPREEAGQTLRMASWPRPAFATSRAATGTTRSGCWPLSKRRGT